MANSSFTMLSIILDLMNIKFCNTLVYHFPVVQPALLYPQNSIPLAFCLLKIYMDKP